MVGAGRDDHGMTREEIAEIQSRYGLGPNLAADLAVLTAIWWEEQVDLRLLLIQRKNKPFQGQWALPGGFVDMDEDLETAARRELQEETGIGDLGSTPIEQLGAFGNPWRDPRSRVVSAVFLAWVRHGDLPEPQGGDDAASAEFVSLRQGIPVDKQDKPLRLAFDHDVVLQKVWQRVRLQTAQSSIPLVLLPERFSTRQLVALYEALIGPSESQPLLTWLQHHDWIRPEGSWWVRGDRVHHEARPAWTVPPLVPIVS
jgi:8-oxo-dGTP diphosphatase